MLTLNYLAMVVKHVLAVNIEHIWKECNPKHNTAPYWIYEGQIVSLLNQVMNLLDGSLFNSSLIFRNLKNRNLIFSHVGLWATGELSHTEYTSCRKGNGNGSLWISPVSPAKGAEPGRAWSQSLVMLQVMHLSWAQKTSVLSYTQKSLSWSQGRSRVQQHFQVTV